MRYFTEKNIKKIIFASLICLVGILSIIFGGLYIIDKHMELEKDLPKIKQEFINQHKKNLKYAVTLQISQIDFRRNQIKKNMKTNLKSRVLEARTIAENLFITPTEFKTKSEKENLARQALAPIRFNQNRCYFFAFDMDGVVQLYPPDPSIEGLESSRAFDKKKLQTIENLTKIIKKHGEGFLEYEWSVPDEEPGKLLKKVSYVTHLKSYDWVIGAGEYYQDVSAMTKENILEDIASSMGENPENYFFIYQLHNIQGGKNFATMIVNPNRPDLIHTKLSDDYKGAKGHEFRKSFLKGLRENGEAFVTYWYKKPGVQEPKQKLSYFKLYPEWNWVVAKGIYLDNLEQIIAREKQELEIQVKNKLVTFSLFFLLAVSIVIGVAFFTKGINAIFVDYKTMQEKQHRELQEINTYLQKKAITDNLTELYNRQYFNERLNQEILRVNRYNHLISLVLFDIDHFKKVNDTYGHIAGDSVLKELSDLIQSQIRNSDILARWGGEEFVILILKTDKDATHAIADKLCRKVAQHKFGINHQITCSFGVTAYIPKETTADFINRADEALYEAKNTGRNRMVYR